MSIPPPPAQDPHVQATAPQPPYGVPGVGAPGAPSAPKKSRKHLIGYPLVALIALGMGAASRGGSTTTAAGGAATTTVTATTTETAPAGGSESTVTETETATETTTVTPKPTGAPSSVPGDGIYEVGRDIKAGTYSSAKPDSGNCYWARLSGTDGLTDILANNNSSGQSLVTIKATDKFFETNGCSEWFRR